MGPPQLSLLKKSVAIDAPLETVFAFWSDIRNFPRFIPLIESVEVIDAYRSRWVVRTPLGRMLAFDSEIVDLIPCEELAWETRHPLGLSSGRLQFRALGTTTRVDCLFEYSLGPAWLRRLAAMASTLGFPSNAFDDGLRRIKREIETKAAGSL